MPYIPPKVPNQHLPIMLCKARQHSGSHSPSNLGSSIESTKHRPEAEAVLSKQTESSVVTSPSGSIPIHTLPQNLVPTSLSSDSAVPTPTTSTTTSTSASSTSIASFSSSDQILDADASTGTGMTSPQDEGGEGMRMDDAVARYKEGLYAYTVSDELEPPARGTTLIETSLFCFSASASPPFPDTLPSVGPILVGLSPICIFSEACTSKRNSRPRGRSLRRQTPALTARAGVSRMSLTHAPLSQLIGEC